MPYTCLQCQYIRKTVTGSSRMEPLANLFHHCSQYKAATLQLFSIILFLLKKKCSSSSLPICSNHY